MQRLGDLRPDEGGTDDYSPRVIDDDARRTRGVATDEACPRVFRSLYVNGSYPETLLLGPGGGEADRRQLRLGEDHAGRAGQVGRRRHVAPKNLLDADPGLVLAHVCEQRSPVDIPDRVEPV